jgi:hypothetical protein
VVTLAFIINSAVCALGSGVFDRYQARVSWLFLLSSMLIAFQLCQGDRGSGTASARQKDCGATAAPPIEEEPSRK